MPVVADDVAVGETYALCDRGVICADVLRVTEPLTEDDGRTEIDEAHEDDRVTEGDTVDDVSRLATPEPEARENVRVTEGDTVDDVSRLVTPEPDEERDTVTVELAHVVADVVTDVTPKGSIARTRHKASTPRAPPQPGPHIV